MPLERGLQLGMKEGTVELCATLHEPHKDPPESFLEAVATRLFEHQYLAMTDPAILDPDDLKIASCIVSRDPVPDVLKNGLTSLGFQPEEMDAGGRDSPSMFSRLSRGKQRASLDKWRTDYLRAVDVSERLSALEESLIEDTPLGPYAEIKDAGAEALATGFRTCFRALIAPGLAGLRDLERALLSERARVKGRLILHPAFVRSITCFVIATFDVEAPGTALSEEEDDDAPLEVPTRSGVVRTDPELRVVRFVARGNKELLSSYVEGVLSQSGNETR